MSQKSTESLVAMAGGFGVFQIILILWYTSVCWVVAGNMLFMVFAKINVPSNNGTAAEPYFYGIVPEFNLTGDLSGVVYWIISAQFTGVLVGSAVGGFLGDRFGRKRVFDLSLVLTVALGVATAFAPNWQVFGVIRALLGVPLGSITVLMYVRFVELLPSKYRTIVFLGDWPLGIVILSSIAMFTKHWQSCTIVVNCLGVLPIVLGLIIPESPTWLLDMRRPDDAIAVITRIAVINRVDRQGRETVFEQLTEAVAKMQFISLKSKSAYSYADLFATRRSKIYTSTMLMCMFSVAFVTYGLAFNIASLPGNAAVTMLLYALIRMAVNVITVVLDTQTKCYGRKNIMSIGWLASGAASSFIVYTIVTDTRTVVSTLVMAVGMAISTKVWLSARLYQVELYPSVLRSQSSALANVIARVGTILGPLALKLTTIHPIFPMALIACISVINLIVMFVILPETKGKPLVSMDEFFGDKAEKSKYVGVLSDRINSNEAKAMLSGGEEMVVLKN